MQSLRTRTQQLARARACYHFVSQPQSARNFKTSKTFFTSVFSNRLQGYNILSPLADLQQRVNISWLSRHGATVTFYLVEWKKNCREKVRNQLFEDLIKDCIVSADFKPITGISNIAQNQHFTTKRQDESSQGGNVQMISVTFVEKDGEEKMIEVPIGMSMLEAAHQNDIELEGACEGSLACSTCHVIMENHDYNKLPEPTDEENDMLDLAFGLTETSRLGCQVVAIPELDGMRIALPSATRNFAVDGYVPKPH